MLQREDGARLHNLAPLFEGVLHVALVVVIRRFEFPAAKKALSRNPQVLGPRVVRLLGRQRRRPRGARHQRQDGRLSSLDEVGRKGSETRELKPPTHEPVADASCPAAQPALPLGRWAAGPAGQLDNRQLTTAGEWEAWHSRRKVSSAAREICGCKNEDDDGGVI